MHLNGMSPETSSSQGPDQGQKVTIQQLIQVLSRSGKGMERGAKWAKGNDFFQNNRNSLDTNQLVVLSIVSFKG